MSLREALAMMFASGVDALAVTGDGAVLGMLTLAGIRERAHTSEPQITAARDSGVPLSAHYRE